MPKTFSKTQKKALSEPYAIFSNHSFLHWYILASSKLFLFPFCLCWSFRLAF